MLVVINTMMNEFLVADLAVELPDLLRFERLVKTLKAEFQCGAVALLKLEGEVLKPLAVTGLVKETLGRRFLPAQHPRLAAILTSEHQPVCFEHSSALPDPYDGLLDQIEGQPLPVHDCMGMRLEQDGKVWGVITFDSLLPGTFSTSAQSALKQQKLLLEAAIRTTRLEMENRSLRQSRINAAVRQEGSATDDAEIVGRSLVLQQLLGELDTVADSELPVLLLGETGVGKELFARRLHQHSRRANKPLIHVNCAALPESLAESELFGHVKGAFSGAHQERAGKFEAANGGTLFLDEVGELPLAVQAKLLRALQNGEIQRLGADKPRKVDVRIIAATNRQLKDSVKQGDFRADLYHRLSVYPVPIPPLRERGNDVLLLAGHFLEQNRARLGLRSLRLSTEAEAALLAYQWPGNIRELEHVISRAAIKCLGRNPARGDISTLVPDLMDLDIEHSPPTTHIGDTEPSVLLMPLKTLLDQTQRKAIQAALDANGQNWAQTAKLLEVDPSNLHKLAKRLGMK
ncbi:anaerobic nitric oxide reductase transcriptional regulator [Bowmanella pacifica]|uniref:Anaerobic nitric oxide reductase transcriptional regulator n=2 Tax=Bowmanella pacifica TaxID=502051 RepID=A0A917Z1M1_9ALTE|nr:anaerobic nitric oxide reductase transcriptional regulator [Bowmanella pacifica]